MKISNLMINDWVCNPIHLIYTKITEICVNHNTQELTASTSDGRTSLTKYDPIPLTIDILKINGFDLEANGSAYTWYDDIYDTNQVYVAISFRRDGTVRAIEVRKHNAVLSKELLPSYGLYVHELQQILRVTGFGELADNFKTTKDEQQGTNAW